MYKSFGKRLLDVIWSLISISVLSPLLLIVSILLLVFDSGPVLFTQTRIGRNGVPFRFYKFRSMPVDTPNVSSDCLENVRMTLIGRLIRRTSIDELPQLFNILIGDMSVVGPRPPLADQVELINLRRHNGSLALRPGLTGLAQIRSYNGMSFREKAAFDADYCRSVSFPLDIAIIFQTIFYLFKSPPTY